MKWLFGHVDHIVDINKKADHIVGTNKKKDDDGFMQKAMYDQLHPNGN